MRSLARLGLGVFGLALAAAPATQAQAPAQPPAAGDGSAPVAVAPASGHHHHKGLFGSRHCVECQRAWVKKHDGVDIPPPPSMLPPGVVASQVVHDHRQGTACAACEAGAVAIAPVAGAYPPGHASLGGPEMAGSYPPGHAVLGMPGEDPAPVGVARNWQGKWAEPRMGAAGPRAYDPSVLPSSMFPAQTALDGESSNRPHVISHLLGVGGISRHVREAREQRRREAHASIAYDSPNQPVTSLPASAVYDRGH
jgi:hypothetical protein